MSLLLSPDALAARRSVVRGPLAPLAASLRHDLGAVLAACSGGVWLPAEKARLTRAGGVCPRDGARLRFDPFSPYAHRCPRCRAVYTDDAHYRWWIMGYHLWLAERAVHAASLHALGVDRDGPRPALGVKLAPFAVDVLSAYTGAYLWYPNADNVLGPTRPFFSTYLESLWLLQICVALDLLEAVDAAPAGLGTLVRNRVIEPSAALIASYDEGWSNRQAWHVAARLAAARLLDRTHDAEQAVYGAHGLVALLDRAFLADGTWYEGENYHQFAHRGLWYALTMAERAYGPLPDATRGRFALGFGAPFRVALPDLSLPARRDSQYAVSLRQWRWAEWCELGLAFASGDGRMAGALHTLYAPGEPRGDVGRWRATGESERNEPASGLTRADLGWKSLLFALPAVPDVEPAAPETVLEARQGFAVFRRDRGKIWVGVDYGASGGGHGHADRLNLTLADGRVRWLDDMGTGTYVDPTLYWYRSTLAHQAPLTGGASQLRADGELLAFDERGALGTGWIDATARIAPQVTARRSVVVCEGYVLDVLRWAAAKEITVDLPIHVDAPIDGVGPFSPADPGGARGLEDGFDFLHDVVSAACAPGTCVRLRAVAPAPHDAAADGIAPAANAAELYGWIAADAATTWFRAVAPGPPGAGDRAFYFVRQQGREGRIVSVWDLRRVVTSMSVVGDAIVVCRVESGEDAHTPDGDGWQIARTHADWGGEDRIVQLRGANTGARSSPHDGDGPPVQLAPCAPLVVLSNDARSVGWTLAADHYLRSEVDWNEAGRPTARVMLRVSAERVLIGVDVHLGREPVFIPADAANVLDNERADVNSDGVQLLVVPAGADAQPLAWLLVPQRDATVRVTPTTPAAVGVALQADWQARANGFAMTCTLPLAVAVPPGVAEPAFGLDVAVNERPPGRERRRGQLMLSGARGERVYLRGDRMDAARALVVRLPRP